MILQDNNYSPNIHLLIPRCLYIFVLKMQWDWKPSSTFADLALERQTTAAAGKKSKTKNKDREKTSATMAATASPAQDSLTSSPPSREMGRRHTPATYPRTRHIASVRERAELEMLRQQLTFSDVEEVFQTGHFSQVMFEALHGVDSRK